MKKLLLFLGISAFVNLNSQNFTWVQGTSTLNIYPVYGTMGSPSPLNSPGSRHGCAHWVDAAGDLWLFGGEADQSNWHSDLWKYTVSTNQWTWIRGANTINATGNYGTIGTAAPTNEPGAREFPASWVDAAGNFWMFGGSGYASTSTFGHLGDLWKYNPITNEWTWMNGFNIVAQPGVYGTLGTSAPGNMPGCRNGAGTWKDASGNLWLYGGRGIPATVGQGYLNDLWKYDPLTNQWTWISGANVTNQFGQYGTVSVPATGNVPGSRYFPQIWADVNSDLYMFGGLGFSNSSVPGAGHLSDLWKYDANANTWTWLNGPNTVNNTGVYGTLGVPNVATIPGGRFTSTTWADASGNLWTFGGQGWSTTSASGIGELNDLFRYNIANNEWTWMGGSNQLNQNGTYGTMGVPSPGNIPGARMYNTWWKTPDGRFWLYGGEGYDATQSTAGNNNDLWTYSSPCNPDSVTIVPGNILCTGASVTLTAHNGGPSTMWYSSPTSTQSLANGTVFTNATLTAVSGPSVYTYYAEANSCTATPRPFITFTINPLPSLTITPSQTLICKGETATLTVSGANTYTWSAGSQTTAAITVTANNAGTPGFTVTGTSSDGCVASLTQTVQVSTCTGINQNMATNIFVLFPNPNKGDFNVRVSGLDSPADLEIYNALGQAVFKHNLVNSSTIIKTELAPGLYYYQLKASTKLVAGGKLVIE